MNPGGLDAVKRAAPGPLRKILRGCLEKQRDRRFQTLTDLCLAWDDVIRLPSSPPKAHWFSGDRRVSIEDDAVRNAWEEEVFPDRGVAYNTIINVADINRAKEIISFLSLGDYDRVRDEARRLLGGPDERGSYLEAFLSGTLSAESQQELRQESGNRKVYVRLSRTLVAEMVAQWLQALVNWLGDHEAEGPASAAFNSAMTELRALAEQLAAANIEEHDLRVLAGEGLVITGHHEQGERLLADLAESHPEDIRVWFSLLYSLARRGASKDHRRILAGLLSERQDTKDPAWLLFLAGGLASIAEFAQSVPFALRAHEANPRNIEALYEVCRGLIGLGRLKDAEEYFGQLERLNPTHIRTQQVRTMIEKNRASQ